jgi:hypothetical protein
MIEAATRGSSVLLCAERRAATVERSRKAVVDVDGIECRAGV